MSLIALFRFRANTVRSPLEDFLTESLATLLRLIGSEPASVRAIFYRDLLGLTVDEAHQLAVRSLRWETQHAVARSGRAGRVDLAALETDGGAPITLFIECKVDAPPTLGTDGSEQCQVYLGEIADRARRGELCFFRYLTHITRPPEYLGPEQVIRWRTLANQLRARLKEHVVGQDVRHWSNLLLDFLEEHGMGAVSLTLADVASVASGRKLREACRHLGDIGSGELERAGPFAGFARPLRTGFGEPNFYGLTLTPDVGGGRGKALGDACAAIWAGVLTQSTYAIALDLEDIPELSVGFALWGYDRSPGIAFEAMRDVAGQTLASFAFKGWRPERDAGGVGWWVRSLPLHQLAVSSRVDEEAASFFRESIGELRTIPAQFFKSLVELSEADDA